MVSIHWPGLRVLMGLILFLGGSGVFADPHSFSNPGQIRTTHLDLDLRVDFEGRRLGGSVTLHFERVGPGDRLVLDTRDVTVERVHGLTPEGERRVGFRLRAPHPLLGSALEIEVPSSAFAVRIDYWTSPTASALGWMEPEKTAAGKGPFLFTQSQAIHARSWIPCQDSPGVRVSYEARLKVPTGLTAVMSAETLSGDLGAGEFRFRMPQRIPSYLVALAVGVLESRDISPRVRIYAEPPVVDEAAWEFADTEAMIKSAEKLFGPYRWDRYDMIVLPPSFPFGGMENPRLTFLTPTCLAGDRTLVDLIAHELAHSWSGNLVTNRGWGDLWINEGFTVYLERLIVEEVYGREAAEMNFILGRRSLEETVAGFGSDHPLTRLAMDLHGRDPDDSFSDVAYEKGALLLHRLEEIVGREKLTKFLRGYFDAHAFGNVSTPEVERAVRTQLLSGLEVPDFDLSEWLYAPGLPEDAPRVRTEAFSKVDREILRLTRGGKSPEDLETEGWRTQQWLHFLRNLPRRLTREQMADLDEAFGFTATGNSEVFFNWAELSLLNHYSYAYPQIEEFLCGMGRMKFVGPLFRLMAEDESLQQRARKIYRQARSLYHPLGVTAMDELLGRPTESSPDTAEPGTPLERDRAGSSEPDRESGDGTARFLDAARGCANYLLSLQASESSTSGDSTSGASAAGGWPIHDGPGAPTVFHLYSGMSGGILLLGLMSQVGSPADRDLYSAGWRRGLEVVAGPGSTTARGRGEGSLWPFQLGGTRGTSGLYTGDAGIAYVLSEFLGETSPFHPGDELRGRIEKQARAAVDLLIERGAGGEGILHWESGTDVISGAAGIGLGLLSLGRTLRIEEAKSAAASAGRWLISQRIEDGEGWKWKVTEQTPRIYPNFSHGTSGVGYFLARLYEETGEDEFLAAARRAARYLEDKVILADSGCTWFHHEGDGEDLIYVSYCHGPPGTARFFEQLYQVTNEERWRRRVLDGGRWLLASGIPQPDPPLPGYWNDSACCGDAGIGDFYLDLHSITGDEVWLRGARRLGDHLLSKARRRAGHLSWEQAEHRVRPEDTLAQTGWAQGVAGIGLFFLRLALASGEVGSTKVGWQFPDSPFASG